MQVNYLGAFSFRIRLNRQIIVTDPFQEKDDQLMPKTKGDIVTFSYSPISKKGLERIKKDDPFIIRGPGEYEISDVSIFGMPTYQKLEEKEKKGKNNIYVFMAKDMRVCHLGRLKDELSKKIIDEIDGVDILIIPVDSEEYLTEKQALKLIKKLNPEIVIPISFNGLDQAKRGLNKFLEEGGFQTVERKDRLVVRSSQLPEETKIVILEHV